MQEQLGLLIKVLGLSLVISSGIKYIPILQRIPPNNQIALVAIALPTIIIALLLWMRSQTSNNPQP